MSDRRPDNIGYITRMMGTAWNIKCIILNIKENKRKGKKYVAQACSRWDNFKVIVVLYLSQSVCRIFLSCFYYSFCSARNVCCSVAIPLMIPARFVEMYPVFGSAKFCRRCRIQDNYPQRYNMCQLWSIIQLRNGQCLALVHPIRDAHG